MRQRKVNYCCNWSFFSQSLAITTPPGLWWGHKDQTHTQSIGQFSTAGSCSILIAVPRSVGILYYCRNTHQGILLFVALLSPRVVWACYTCAYTSRLTHLGEFLQFTLPETRACFTTMGNNRACIHVTSKSGGEWRGLCTVVCQVSKHATSTQGRNDQRIFRESVAALLPQLDWRGDAVG